MNIRLKNFFDSFRLFLSGPGKYILFTTLFYALWLVRTAIFTKNFELHSFSGRMIGLATLEDYDVGARVSLFYNCVVLLLFSFTLFNFIGYLFFKKATSLFYSSEIKIINYSSLAGILFILFELCRFETSETMEMVYFIHKLMFGSILLKLFFFPKNQLTIFNYTLAILISVACYFFVADCYNFCGQVKNPDFLITTFIICCLLIIGTNLFLNNGSPLNQQARLSTFAYILVPLSSLPLISVLKDEIFLVCKTNGILLNNPMHIYGILIAVLACIIFIRRGRTKNSLLLSQKKLVAKNYFPILIFSLITYINYSYYIKYSDEVFEAGNKYLAVMEFKLFGVIPTLEKFNSHLLSDYFFSAIYTFFNGLQGHEMELYDFLYVSFSCVLYYYLIYFITRNSFIAAFSILFFPLCSAMLPEAYALCVLAIFALHKTISTEQTLKKYLLFFIIMAWLVVWRIDLGYSCLLAMSIMLIYYHFFSHAFKINWRLLFKAVFIFLVALTVIFALISFYRNVNLFEKIINALNYFTSAQTYGYSSVGPKETLIYKMHYFIFPALVCFLVIALIVKHNDLNKSRSQRLAYMALLFTCVFYLVNFNRGLIRHSLIEGIDHFTSSLIYLIIPGAFFVFFQKNTQAFKFIVFCSLAFFILINYKLPDPKESICYFESLLNKIHTTENTALSKVDGRVKDPSNAINKDKAFIEFIRKNTTEKETFVDFSNSPMLYFSTKKITPSYFYQNPICSHNDFLQNVFLKDLKDYNAPYLVFSRQDDMSRDIMDDVPNTLRHYRMAEYFFRNYKPYVFTGPLAVWKRNDVKDNNAKKSVYVFKKNESLINSDSLLETEFKINADKKYLLKIILQKNAPIELDIKSGNEPVFNILDFVNDSVAYTIIDPKGKTCRIKTQKKYIHTFEILECDYIPDLYSEKFSSYAFLKLPYIWGTLDKKISNEPILFEKNTTVILQENTPYAFAIPEKIDRTSGNTILIHCKNNSSKTQKLTLCFGNSVEKNKTTISFDIVPSEKEEKYAVRISSVYKWYSDKIDEVGLTTSANKDLTITRIQITKGM